MFILYNKLLPDKISSDQRQSWLNELPKSKYQKIKALKQEQDQLRCLIGNQLLKTGMRLLGETDFHLNELEYSEHGKPFTQRPVSFSISHADSLICCALSTKGQVGIDTEFRTKLQNTELTRYFSEDELSLIKSTPSSYSSLWTRKEAICKASGDKGLEEMPHIKLQNNCATLHGKEWWLYTLDLHQNYITHLASNRSVDDLTLCEIDLP